MKNFGPFKTFRTFNEYHCMNLNHICWKTSPRRCFAQRWLIYYKSISSYIQDFSVLKSLLWCPRYWICCIKKVTPGFCWRHKHAKRVCFHHSSRTGLDQAPSEVKERIKFSGIKPLGFPFCKGLFYKWIWLSEPSTEKIDSGWWTIMICAVDKDFRFIFKVRLFFP